jgi:hypothetical protein
VEALLRRVALRVVELLRRKGKLEGPQGGEDALRLPARPGRPRASPPTGPGRGASSPWPALCLPGGLLPARQHLGARERPRRSGAAVQLRRQRPALARAPPCPPRRREVKVLENPGGDGRAEDTGHHAARAAAAEAGEDVHGERPLQQLGPGQPERAGSAFTPPPPRGAPPSHGSLSLQGATCRECRGASPGARTRRRGVTPGFPSSGSGTSWRQSRR